MTNFGRLVCTYVIRCDWSEALESVEGWASAVRLERCACLQTLLRPHRHSEFEQAGVGAAGRHDECELRRNHNASVHPECLNLPTSCDGYRSSYNVQSCEKSSLIT